MVDTNRVTGAVKEFAGKAQGAVGDALGSSTDSVQGRLREASGAAENMYGQAKDAVRNVAGQAGDYAEDIYDNRERYVRQGSREIVQQVKEYPLSSLVIAGAIGFGLGLLARGGRD